MCCCWHWKQYRSSGIIESSYNSCFIQEEISNLGFYWRSLLVKSAKYCHCIRKSFSCNIHLWSIEALRCYHESATVVYSSWHVRKYGFCFPACQIIASCCCLHLNACVYFFVEMQVLWLSDGAHTVHVTSVSDVEHSVRETDENENTEKEMQIAGLPKSISWLSDISKPLSLWTHVRGCISIVAVPVVNSILHWSLYVAMFVCCMSLKSIINKV